MSIKNPTVFKITNPVGIEKAIQNVQTALEALTWLQKSFGRASLFYETRASKLVKVPKVQLSETEYDEVMYNDNLTAHSFFYVDGYQNLEEYTSNQLAYYYETKASLFVFANLELITPNKRVHELQQETFDILTKQREVKAVTRIIDTNSDIIFKEFTIDPTQRELLMWPRAALRFELTLSYQQNCLS